MITEAERLMDRQLDIIKELFNLHTTTTKEITELITSAALMDLYQVDSKLLLDIMYESNERIKLISSKL